VPTYEENMKKITEIPLRIRERQEVTIPVGGQILGWRGQGEEDVFMLVQSYVHEQRTQTRVFQMFNTGEGFDDNRNYMGTIVMEDDEQTPIHILEEPVQRTLRPLHQPRTRG
jgi:hypothetical protein